MLFGRRALETRCIFIAGRYRCYEGRRRGIELRTKLSICNKKIRYPSEQDAASAAQERGLPQRPYRCDRCGQFHLTSRTKGKRMRRPSS